MRAIAIVAVLLAMTGPAMAETVHLYAAGSLRGALTDMAKAFEAATGNTVQSKFGASGLLKDEIVGGAKADVFASANMEHPQALHDAGKSGTVVLFTRNKLCALVKPGLTVDSAGLLTRMLDPGVKLATSTPKADPSGDYAFAAFAKAEAIKPGAQAALEKKALLLTGAADSAVPPPGRSPYGWHLAEGRADIFLTYCTNALAARKEILALSITALPESLNVGADYGLTVMNGAAPAAQALAQFIVSPEGQKILTGYGFAPAGNK
ncbi:MAG TPA: molybdate ABC transporter substrate-binding protein [Pseudolabrys sp.]